MIGKRALDDPRNGLLVQFLRLVVDLDANYFVFENVKGLTIGEHRKLLDELIEAFQGHGYSVLLPYQVLNAADFGVPQDRRRVFLIGAKMGLPLPVYPEPLGRYTSVAEVIGDLPNADDFSELMLSDILEDAPLGKGSRYARILRGQAQDNSDFSYPRRWSPELLTSSMRTAHTPLSRRRFTETPHGKVESVSRFLKLNPDGLCNTLRAGTGSERGAFTSPHPIRPHLPRVITVREAARLHSYPDWFRLHATKWHGFRQIGNSVPPLLGRVVASRLIEAMNIAPEKPSEKLDLGGEWLLSVNMSGAASYYAVAGDVVGRRLRVPISEQRELFGTMTA